MSLDSRERLKSVLVASGLEKETGQCWECGGIFKGGRGLKVHLARSSCGHTNSSSQCFPSSSGGGPHSVFKNSVSPPPLGEVSVVRRRTP